MGVIVGGEGLGLEAGTWDGCSAFAAAGVTPKRVVDDSGFT